MSKVVTLPSGTRLEISPASFPEAKALYQAVIGEAKSLKVSMDTEIDVNLFKDALCACLDSPRIEAALAACFRRCTYGGHRISDETWEPLEARGDYLIACFEVAKENLLPFGKSLYAQYRGAIQGIKSSLASR